MPLVYRQLTTRSIEVWPGTFEMLAACSDFRLGIASNTQRAYTEPELRMLGLWDSFEVVVFSSDVRACKPDPAIFRAALAELDVPASDVVYVGDNPHDDVLGASLLDIPTILLDRGTPVADGAQLGLPLATIPDGDADAVARVARSHFGIDT
ncbi:HAD family hydrolase [Aeromicrobium sp. UC242_57]|uniref:HAD family hydrolase n=1 Tax=Aeromicrobium sp. UC242_57 TaxID=3374624 RepID=UPI0037B48A1A